MGTDRRHSGFRACGQRGHDCANVSSTYLRAESIRDRRSRGEAAEYVEAAARVFDPNVLTVGFARRVATYKRRRGTLLTADSGSPSPLLRPRRVDASGIPQGWVRRVKAAMRTLIPHFSADRPVREYFFQPEDVAAPALESSLGGTASKRDNAPGLT